MGDPTDDELREDILSVIGARVRAGFLQRDEIWLDVDDICEQSERADALREFGATELKRQWEAQRAAEKTWEGRTDCDRLDAAFAELEETGIVCRQDFTCCGNCGVAEIGGELEAAAKNGVRVLGYAFYHMQDTERAVDGGGVYLSYGATEQGEAAALAVARDIVSVLKSHGLEPSWNGEYKLRIALPLQWRRRLRCT